MDELKDKDDQLELRSNSVGLISSSRTGNGMQTAENLLAYMEKRLGAIGGSHQKEPFSDVKLGSEGDLQHISLTNDKD